MKTEFQLIQKLTRTVGDRTVGDDCSIHRNGRKDILVTVDSLVENTHFRRDWGTFDLFGEKLAGAALSDIAAMGGKPRRTWIVLEVDARTSEKECAAFYRGLLRVLNRFGVTLEGGNTTTSRQFAAHLTVWGDCPSGKALRRGNAKIGDTVFVGGNLGWAGLGLKIQNSRNRELKRGKNRYPAFRKALLQPAPLIALGEKLARSGRVHACIDVSDGLIQDLEHVARASNIRIEIETGKIPLNPQFQTTAEKLGLDPLRLALTGGEDYALAFTGRGKLPGTAIGHVRRGKAGVYLLDRQGQPIRSWRRQRFKKGFCHVLFRSRKK